MPNSNNGRDKRWGCDARQMQPVVCEMDSVHVAKENGHERRGRDVREWVQETGQRCKRRGCHARQMQLVVCEMGSTHVVKENGRKWWAQETGQRHC